MRVLAFLLLVFSLAGCSVWNENFYSSDGSYERRSGSSFGVAPSPPVGYVYTAPPVILGPPPPAAIGYFEDPAYGHVWVGWSNNAYVYLGGGPRMNIAYIGQPIRRDFYGRRYYHFNRNYYRPPPPYRPYRSY